jgi:hypothetical protein
VTHLVAQIPQDVRVIETFDVTDALAVHGRQLGMSQVKRNTDDDGAEWHAPFRRQMKARHDFRDAAARELGAKLLDDRFQARAVDRQPEVTDRRAEQVAFAETLRGGHG